MRAPRLNAPGLSAPSAPAAEPRKRSFPPVVDRRSRLLVLGTLPGEESLRRQEYYAHPRNLFWPIVCGLFDADVPTRYDERLRFALRQGLALWDVVADGERTASADATIRGEVPNTIADLLAAYPGIRAVAFNGSGAQRLHDRHFVRRADIRYLALPSTSPAHARLSYHEKLARWRALQEVLAGG